MCNKLLVLCLLTEWNADRKSLEVGGGEVQGGAGGEASGQEALMVAHCVLTCVSADQG